MRGGPLMRSPGFRNFNAEVGTDERKAVVLGLGGATSSTRAGGWEAGGGLGVTLKPTPALSIASAPNFSREFDIAQYVRTVTDPTATATYGARYVFGQLEQTELSMATRVNIVISPRMSLQMYVQPLLSVGGYTFLEEAAAPRTYDFLRYGLDTGSIAYDAEREVYEIDPDAAGSGALRSPTRTSTSSPCGSTPCSAGSSARARRPTSSGRSSASTKSGRGRLAIPSDFSELVGEPSDNVFMVKVSYWFSR